MSSRLRFHRLPNVVFALIASTSLFAMAFPESGMAQSAAQKVRLDIPAQDLSASLTQFGRETGTEIEFAPDVVREKKGAAVKGEFERDQALKLILKGTGLTYRTTPQGAIVVEASKPTANRAIVNHSLANTSGSSDSTNLEEIIVTAQKRSERLQDVPVPVTTLKAQELVASNQIRMQDYFTRVPGLTVTPDDENGAPIVTIRGITTGGYTNPTVGIVVDDVPFGSSTSTAVGNIAPDIDPFDLADIEVLRGPQGTLYGAGSMGGLIKYTTVDPSFDGISGRVQAGTETIYNAAQLGYNVRGAVNLPLNDTFAIRASAFTREDPGYIDNAVHNINGINKSQSDGAHLLALWKPSDTFSIKLSALYQDDKRFGSNDVFAALGDLKQDFLLNTGRYSKRVQAYNATIRAKVGGVDFVSISGYSKNNYQNTLDFSSAFSFYVPPVFGVSGVPSFAHVTTNKASQEFRFSGSFGGSVDWLAGAFYTYEDSPAHTDVFAENPQTGLIVGKAITFNFPTTFQEYAAFGDLTYHVTRHFDIQLGFRESQNTQSYNETDTGQIVLAYDGSPSPFVYPEQKSKDRAFTYLVTPQYKLSSDLMLYARLASGYRPGGPNPGAQLYGFPSEFGADKTQDYEIGVKGNVLHHSLTFDASAYYIPWKDIQVLAIDPVTFIGFYANGTRAKSEGVELSLQAQPIQNLLLSAWIAWNKSVLTEPFSPTTYLVGAAGDRLPYGSRFSGNISLDQGFSLGSQLRASIGGTVSYVGEREGEFATLFSANADRQVLPSYSQLDVRAGLTYQSWDLRLSVNNVADKRGLLRGGLNSIYPYAFNYTQPRTVGLSIAKSF